MDDLSELKNRIKYIRKISCRGTQEAFGEILGVRESRVKSLETGRVKDLTLAEAKVMVKKFNVNLDWLESGDGDIYDYGQIKLGEINKMAEAGDDRAKQMSETWGFMKDNPFVQIDWYHLSLDDIEAAADKGDKKAQAFMYDLNPFWGMPDVDDISEQEISDILDMQKESKERERFASEFVRIPIYDIQASAGSGCLVESEDQKSSINFSQYYLSSLGVPAKQAAIIYVKGDSMLGTLDPDVPILVDTSIRTMQQDGIYVIRICDTLHVKRVQRMMDGSLKIISDNEFYEPYVISGHDLETVQIVGRVVLSVRLF